jgi:hypothetical protein
MNAQKILAIFVQIKKKLGNMIHFTFEDEDLPRYRHSRSAFAGFEFSQTVVSTSCYA